VNKEIVCEGCGQYESQCRCGEKPSTTNRETKGHLTVDDCLKLYDEVGIIGLVEKVRDISFKLGYDKALSLISPPEVLSEDEIRHILETQEYMCNIGKADGDDGKCAFCQSIEAKLKATVDKEME